MLEFFYMMRDCRRDHFYLISDFTDRRAYFRRCDAAITGVGSRRAAIRQVHKDLEPRRIRQRFAHRCYVLNVQVACTISI
jgi:hypothetical protein